MNAEQHAARGQRIIDLLSLKVKKSGEAAGRVETTSGTKTPEGLSRTIERVFEDFTKEQGGRTYKFAVYGVRWYDRFNTYHSVRCVRLEDGAVLTQGMTYGYEDAYRQTALKLMHKNGWIEYPENDLWSYERENNYPIEWHVSDGLKRDMVRNAEA